MILLDISSFLGRLHPVLVHLPIGFLVVLVAFDLFSFAPGFRKLRVALPLLAIFSCIATLLAAVFGYILSLEGDYPLHILAKHRNGGLWLLFITSALALVLNSPLQNRWVIPPVFRSAGLFLVLLLTVYVGHQGGNLTHGEDYISWEVLQEKARPRPDSLEAVLVYEDLIQPLLIRRCAQCHRDSKRKGQLSVATIADLIKGGKSGSAIVPGKAGESELMHRVLLDPTDKKFMPADGKTPLTKEETELLGWWIEQGKAAEGIRVGSLPDTAKVRQLAALMLGLGKQPANGLLPVSGRASYPDVPLAVDTVAIRQLREKGFYVRILLHDPVLLDIT
ncbi:c-type cytochrome domain-containing protein, partial [Flavihumibacter sp. CACIAM 22H1]|uniref:c-type cytochrome domain-containing protein n=1 Tax=Flavihumibacter sp. CACIAM 22H1 TaxID=1812911 RepID=UPI0007A92D09